MSIAPNFNKTQPISKVSEPTSEKPSTELPLTKFNAQEKIPSSWTISSSALGVTFYNTQTCRIFVGSIAEFNKCLRE